MDDNSLNKDVSLPGSTFRGASIAGAALLLLSLSTIGVQAGSDSQSEKVEGYRPDNVHLSVKVLPKEMRRILVLPLTGTGSQSLDENREVLNGLLVEELIKSKKFEVMQADPGQLKRRTGKAEWRAEDTLPATYLETLSKDFACDGVLFCHVTAYRAYPPQFVGWKLKLVDVRTGEILWAADEVFDGGQPKVATGARKFIQREMWAEFKDTDWLGLRSPRWFGRYTVASVLQLLPER